MTEENIDNADENAQPLETPEPGAVPAPASDETDEAPEGDDQLKKARKEAAGYRSKLRQAEQERADAHGTVTNLRRQIIEGQAASEGLKPEALWAAGFTPDDLIGETGSIDPEKVTTAILEARERLGISRFTGAADQFAQGRKTADVQTTPSWSNLIHPS